VQTSHTPAARNVVILSLLRKPSIAFNSQPATGAGPARVLEFGLKLIY
jgi:hypothetical protein